MEGDGTGSIATSMLRRCPLPVERSLACGPTSPTWRRHSNGPATTWSSSARTPDGRSNRRTGRFSSTSGVSNAPTATLVETTRYRISIPWFNWLFALPIRALVGRRWHQPHHHGVPHANPWWAPPDRLTERQIRVLGLLAAASMSSAFINTLFTQTVKFAADDFGVDNSGVSDRHARSCAPESCSTLPAAVLADRIGRKRVVTFVAWAAPIVTALGALAPTFPALVATQAVGRPLGLALDFLVAVVAAEEMPRNSRAYAVSVLAMASGLGAGHRRHRAAPRRHRGVVVAVHLRRHARLARRRRRHRQTAARDDAFLAPAHDRATASSAGASRRSRSWPIAANFFVAPASVFQNSYLEDARGFSADQIALFTLSTATPAGIGLIIGGRVADVRGRRRLLAVALPLATTLIVASFAVDGAPMWLSAFGGGFIGGMAYPALAVYRAELFPTGNRGRAAGLLTAAALLGGIGGLQLAGRLLDADWPYGRVMALLAFAQVVVVIVVLMSFPETAHRELEELNPEDAAFADRQPPNH